MCIRAVGLVAMFGWWLTSTPSSALDFHLHSTTVEEDGLKHEQVWIQNDAQTRVGITPPGGWSRADDTNSLTLTPQSIPNGLVKIEKSNVGTSVAFQGPGLEVYRKQVLAEIPQGATALKQGENVADPLPIFGWKSYEYTVDYEFFGQSYRRGVLFLNLNAKEQLMVTALATKADFEIVHSAAMDVMRSWQVVPSHD